MNPEQIIKLDSPDMIHSFIVVGKTRNKPDICPICHQRRIYEDHTDVHDCNYVNTKTMPGATPPD